MWPVPLAQVLPHPQLHFPSKTWIFWNLFEFSVAEITSKSISFKIKINPHFESKSYQINSIKSCTSRFFQTPKAHSKSSEIFRLQFNLIFSEEIIQYSRTFAPQVQTPWNQAHAPLLVESFPKTPRMQSEASQFGGSHKYKQNKQTTFLHR